jgi:putative membrane protein
MNQTWRSLSRRFLRKILVISSVALLSTLMALAQQQPMGGSAPAQQPISPATSNPGVNNAEQMQQLQQQNSAEQSMQEKAFVRAALQGGMAEVELGKLAAQKAASPDVRQFGQKMVNDNSELNHEMKQVAQQMGVREPTGLSKKDKELDAKLETLSGKQFDDAYIKAMVKDHKKDSSDFRQEAENATNGSLKQVAQQGAQVVDGNLQLIEQIAKTHDVKG